MTEFAFGAVRCVIVVTLCTIPAMASLTDMVDEIVMARAQGNSAKAEHVALALIRIAGDNDAKGTILPWALDMLASLKQDQAQYEEAQQLYERSIRLWELRSNGPSLQLAHTLNDLASLYSEIGQLHKSELLCRRSLSIRIQLVGVADPDVALGYSNLATVLYLENRFVEAESSAYKALGIWSDVRPQFSRADLAYNTLARLRLREQRFEEARTYAQSAIRLCQKTAPTDSLHLAEYFRTLGLINGDSDTFDDAQEDFKKALELFKEANAENSLEYVDTRAEYAAMLRRSGHKGEAKRLERECEARRKEIIKANQLQYSIDVTSLENESR
jgi:tetratricopeptide (TPR) repeat protein